MPLHLYHEINLFGFLLFGLSVSIDSLTMQSEFGDKREKEISGFDLIGRDSSISSDEIKVYDVILAGVCR